MSCHLQVTKHDDSNHLLDSNHHWSIEEFPFLTVVPPLFDVCTLPAMCKPSTFCPKSSLTYSKILTVFHPTLNQWQRAIRLPMKCGLILIEEKHPLYNVYGLIFSNNFSSATIKSNKRHFQSTIFWPVLALYFPTLSKSSQSLLRTWTQEKMKGKRWKNNL